MRTSASLHYLGFLFLVVGIAFLIPVFIALIYSEGNVGLLYSFVFPSLVLASVGFWLRRSFKPKDMGLRISLVFAALAWIIVPALGAIPYFASSHMRYEDAFFESMSGFTATGLTIILDVEALPRHILLWRSLTEWLGGVGVIVLFLSIMTQAGTIGVMLYRAEGRTDRISPSILGTVRRIWWIYGAYTILGAILLFAAGMPLFDAVNHSMTAIATGGFSTKNDSIANFQSFWIETAVMVVTVIGAISFATHYQLFRGNLRALGRSEETRMFFLLVAVATILVFLNNAPFGDGQNIDVLARQSVFQNVAALTGSGFSTVNINSMTQFGSLILILMMLTGGAYGSTTGAIKLLRFVIIFKVIRMSFQGFFMPKKAIKLMRMGGHVLENEQVVEAFRYVFLYLLLIAVGTLALTAEGYGLLASLFEVASAAGNVGLTVGITAPDMSLVSKIVLIVEMWAGRLEIVPVLLIFLSLFSRHPD